MCVCVCLKEVSWECGLKMSSDFLTGTLYYHTVGKQAQGDKKGQHRKLLLFSAELKDKPNTDRVGHSNQGKVLKS